MNKTILMILLPVSSSSDLAERIEIGSDKTITIYADPTTIYKSGASWNQLQRNMPFSSR